ncbi:MAG: hypothetical protein DRN06_08990, partial [Thermoprotei archaeon]
MVEVKEVVQVPTEPKAYQPVFIFAKICGNFTGLPRLRVNGTIKVIGPLLEHQYQFGPRNLPMIPISRFWYLSAIPGLPARNGTVYDIRTYVDYYIVVDETEYYHGSYEVSPLNVTLLAPPIAFASIYDVLNNTELFEETLGLSPTGWRVAEGYEVKILIVAIDDRTIKDMSFEYSISGGSWNMAPVHRDPLMDEFEALSDRLNQIIGYIEDIIGIDLPEIPLPIKICNAVIPGTTLGNYVMFRANATDINNKETTSLMGFYYIINETAPIRVLVLDPNVMMWLIQRNMENLLNRLKALAENKLSNYIELFRNVANMTSLADALRRFAHVKFHHWELLGKYFNLYITYPRPFVADLLKPLDEGGFEPHAILLSNMWLGLNITELLNWDLKDIKVNDESLLDKLIEYVKNYHAGLIATHGTLSDWVVWAGCSSDQHYKIGVRGHVGNSLADVNPINETTLSSMLGLPILPVWEVVRDTVARVLCRSEDLILQTLGLIIGSMPLQIPYVPFNQSLRITTSGINHPVLEGIPDEFYIEIPDMPDILVEHGYRAYTEVGWQLSMPSAIAYITWWWINQTRPLIWRILNNVTFLIHNMTGDVFTPPKSFNNLLNESLRWGLLSFYKSIVSMNITDRVLHIRVQIPNREPIDITINFDFNRLLQYSPIKLVALSKNGLAGIVTYDKYWDRNGYRAVYFSFELEASTSWIAERLLRNSINWVTTWEYLDITELLGGIVRVPKELANSFRQAMEKIPGKTLLSDGLLLVEEGYTVLELNVKKDTSLNLLMASSMADKINVTLLGEVSAEICGLTNITSGLINITIWAHEEGILKIGLRADPEASINSGYIAIKSADLQPPSISIITPSANEI